MLGLFLAICTLVQYFIMGPSNSFDLPPDLNSNDNTGGSKMIGDDGTRCWLNKLILKCLVEPGILLLVEISTFWNVVGINDMT